MGNKTARVFYGVHWGDEAKGATCERYALRDDVNVIVRDGGANNCGHQTMRGGRLIKAHCIPVAGTLPGRTAVVAGMTLIMPTNIASVLQPGRFRPGLPQEYAALRELGCHDFKLVLDGRIGLILPPDLELEAMVEGGPHARGTTGSGVAMARARQALTCSVRLIDCFDQRVLTEALMRADWYREHLFATTNQTGGERRYADSRDDLLRLAEWVDRTADVTMLDADRFLRTAWQAGNSLAWEMPQSHGLCMLRGSVPFVTSSLPLQPTGTWFPSGTTSVPVFKMGYVTRVGQGPFLTRHSPEQEAAMRQAGGEFGVSTGRNRDTGDWDAVHARSALDCALSQDGVIRVAGTKLDVLRGTRPRACTSYRHLDTGEVMERWPANAATLGRYEPHTWVELPWFDEDVSAARDWDNLPQGARELVLATEALLSSTGNPVHIESVSVGQESEAVIWRD